MKGKKIMIKVENISHAVEFIKSNDLCLIFVKNRTCSMSEAVLDNSEEALIQEFPEIPSIKVTLEKAPDFSKKYVVFSTPTILLFFRGREVLRQSVFFNFGQLKNDIDLWSKIFISLEKDPFYGLY